MTEPYKRSRSLRRVKVKLPGGRVTTHHKERKPKVGSCPETGQTLKGMPRARPADVKKLSKSQKRPERPFGGVLSSKATRALFKQKARKSE